MNNNKILKENSETFSLDICKKVGDKERKEFYRKNWLKLKKN